MPDIGRDRQASTACSSCQQYHTFWHFCVRWQGILWVEERPQVLRGHVVLSLLLLQQLSCCCCCCAAAALLLSTSSPLLLLRRCERSNFDWLYDQCRIHRTNLILIASLHADNCSRWCSRRA